MPMPTDPVCGHRVDANAAWERGRIARHRSRTYYFCSLACKQEFAWNRHAYVMAIDVVCGREVDPEGAQAEELYRDFEGTRYYFCSRQCQDRFAKAPEVHCELHRLAEEKRGPHGG